MTHIINARRTRSHASLIGTLSYLWNPTEDDDVHPKPVAWFGNAVEFALAALARPGTVVFTHCARGRNRGPTSFRSPWQNGCVERLIGSIRREWYRSSDRAQRRASAANSGEIHRLLQSRANSHFPREGRTVHAPGRTVRPCHCTSDPWRVTPPIRTNLVFGSDSHFPRPGRGAVHSPTHAAVRIEEHFEEFVILPNSK